MFASPRLNILSTWWWIKPRLLCGRRSNGFVHGEPIQRSFTKTHSSVHLCGRKGNSYGSRHWNWCSIIPVSLLGGHIFLTYIAELCDPVETYTNEKLSVLGQHDVTVRYGDQLQKLIITVVDGDGPGLLGRDWLKQLHLNWTQISMVQNSSTQLEDLMKEYSEIFRDELGTIKGFQASLHLKGSPQPMFFRPRPVSFAIRDAVGHELDRLEADTIIVKVTHAERAAPIVAVPKKDGRPRICGDYKVTINPVLEIDQHPLPWSEELFAILSGDEFQKLMENLLSGIPNVVLHLNDILVTGKDDAEHLTTLKAVFNQLQQFGLRQKLPKCRFLQQSGSLMDAKGLHALPAK